MAAFERKLSATITDSPYGNYAYFTRLMDSRASDIGAFPGHITCQTPGGSKPL